MVISDRYLSMCCLEMLVKVCESWDNVYLLIFLYAEHEVRMCSTVNGGLQ